MKQNNTEISKEKISNSKKNKRQQTEKSRIITKRNKVRKIKKYSRKVNKMKQYVK